MIPLLFFAIFGGAVLTNGYSEPPRTMGNEGLQVEAMADPNAFRPCPKCAKAPVDQ